MTILAGRRLRLRVRIDGASQSRCAERACEAGLLKLPPRLTRCAGPPAFNLSTNPSTHAEDAFGTRLRFEFLALKLIDFEPRLDAIDRWFDLAVTTTSRAEFARALAAD